MNIHAQGRGHVALEIHEQMGLYITYMHSK